MAKFLPRDLSTIDDEKRDATILGIVPFDPGSHDSMVGDLRSELAVREMLGGQGAAHLLDQSAKEHEQIVCRITDGLELVAHRSSVAELEGLKGNSGPEQMGAKVEFVDLSCAIDETHRFKPGMFEPLQPGCFGHFRVEALATKLSVPAFDRAVMDDLVARCELTTAVAKDLWASSELGCIHCPSIARPGAHMLKGGGRRKAIEFPPGGLHR